ncbi:hypothetical protein SprV_0200610400 [Sparganum proliferum]
MHLLILVFIVYLARPTQQIASCQGLGEACSRTIFQRCCGNTHIRNLDEHCRTRLKMLLPTVLLVALLIVNSATADDNCQKEGETCSKTIFQRCCDKLPQSSKVHTPTINPEDVCTASTGHWPFSHECRLR